MHLRHVFGLITITQNPDAVIDVLENDLALLSSAFRKLPGKADLVVKAVSKAKNPTKARAALVKLGFTESEATVVMDLTLADHCDDCDTDEKSGEVTHVVHT